MNRFDEVMTRVKDILSKELGEKRVRDKDVAEALGFTPAYFAVLKKRGKVPVEQIADFCALHNISINWMLYDQMPGSLVETTDRYATVRYFRSVNASAGGGALNDEEETEYLRLDEGIVEKLGGERVLKYIDAINVVGDSMEPNIPDGATIFLDRSKVEPIDGEVFVIRTDAGVFVKQLRLHGDGMAEIISLNPVYPSEKRSLESVEIIGRVVGVLEPD